MMVYTMVSFCLPGVSFFKILSSSLNLFFPLCFILPSLLGYFCFWHSNINWSLHIIWLVKHACLTVPNWLEVHEGLEEGVEQGIGTCGIGGVL